jgi:hypothetical protein
MMELILAIVFLVALVIGGAIGYAFAAMIESGVQDGD